MMRLAATAVAAGMIALAPAAPSQAVIGYDPEAPGHSGFTVTAPTSPYLMTFVTCASGADCEDPSNHLIRFAQSTDGASWSDVAGWQPYRGSVPDVVRRGSTIYIIGAGVSKIDVATGAVTAHQFTVTKTDGKPALPRDVSFAGQLPDGRLVIAYVPPMQDIGQGDDVPVMLATEVIDSDGTKFVTSGTAVEVVSGVAGTLGSATDPDIFWNGSTWVLYVSVGSNVVSFTSSDLTGPYDPASATVVSDQSGGVPAGIVGTNGVWTYVNYGPARDDVLIRRAVSSTGTTKIAESSFATVLTGAPYSAGTAESPGLAANVEGIACTSGCTSSSSAEAPGPVQNAAASRVTKSSAKVSWTAPASDGGEPIESVQVRIRKTKKPWSSWTSLSAATTSKTFTGLSKSTKYDVEVRAVNSVGSSTAVRVTFTTKKS